MKRSLKKVAGFKGVYRRISLYGRIFDLHRNGIYAVLSKDKNNNGKNKNGGRLHSRCYNTTTLLIPTCAKRIHRRYHGQPAHYSTSTLRGPISDSVLTRELVLSPLCCVTSRSLSWGYGTCVYATAKKRGLLSSTTGLSCAVLNPKLA